MMHRCSVGVGVGVGVGSCSCCSFGPATTHQTPPSNFSVLFSVPSHHKPPLPSFSQPFDLDLDLDHGPHHYSSPVDCTLSLGTPSTRSAAGYEPERRSSGGGSCMPNFCWDLFQHPKHYSSSSPANTFGNGGGGSRNISAGGNDSLLARRCANCDTTSTPLWRNGPRGPKSLCNACGIRFKKEERRAAAATAGSGDEQQPNSVPHLFNSHNSWINAHTTMQSHKMPSCFSTAAIGNEFRFVDDDGGAGRDSEISFLSWRLNVADRPGLVNDYTR